MNKCHICTKRANLKKHIIDNTKLDIEELYTNIVEIGSGGSSFVFSAKNTKTGKNVALKIIKDAYLKKHFNVQLFREITTQLFLQSKDSLKHHMPKIYQVMYIKKNKLQVLLIEMELIEGTPLHWFIIERHMSYPALIDIFRQVLTFLNSLYEFGYVHNDIKPDNLIFNEKNGAVYIIDYSFVCNVHCKSVCIENCAAIGGTKEYDSVNKLRSPKFNNLSSDIYSLGISIFTMRYNLSIPWDTNKSLIYNIDTRNKIILDALSLDRYNDLALLLRDILLLPDDKLSYIPSIKELLYSLNDILEQSNENLIAYILYKIKFVDVRALKNISSIL